MRKTKIFIVLAAVALAITSFLVDGKNYAKFVSFSTCVTAGGSFKLIGTNAFTTVATGGSQAYLCTIGGTQKPLFTKTNRVKICYLK